MSLEPEYIVGATARISAQFSNPVTYAAVDPGTLLLKIRAPDKSLTTYTFGVDAEIVKDSTGRYHADIALPQAGTYHWRWEASNGNAGVVESSLTVAKSKVL